MQLELEKSIAEASDWARDARDSGRIQGQMAQGGCFIYGAGGFGQSVAASLAGKGYVLHGFIDTFLGGGQLVSGAPCHTPDEFDPTRARGTTLILAVNNYKVPVASIADWARGTGFAEIVFVPELPDILGPELGTYWQASRGLMAENSANIARLHDLLGDERSRAILAALVRYRITGLPEDHPPVDRDHQYFPQDLPLAGPAINVVDCGAFPGDMVEATATAGLRLAHWYAFEPDPRNFAELARVARTAQVDYAALFPCGVSDTTGVIGFASGGGDASRALGAAEDSAGEVVPIVRVEDCVQAQRIDLVKLDIEGFEAQAIDGMTGLLGKHRPRLAMAIYHKPADLWELPFKIAEMFPEARLAIRQHGHNGYDTVLYADL